MTKERPQLFGHPSEAPGGFHPALPSAGACSGEPGSAKPLGFRLQWSSPGLCLDTYLAGFWGRIAHEQELVIPTLPQNKEQRSKQEVSMSQPDTVVQAMFQTFFF